MLGARVPGHGAAEDQQAPVDPGTAPSSGSGDNGAGASTGATEGGSANNRASGLGWRVKLYQLNHEGQWDDKGTGHIKCKFVESLGGTALCVASEENPDAPHLLESKVEEHDVYQRQGDNIITWCETLSGASGPTGSGANPGQDLALSFQENQGCLEIWSQICKVQGRYSTDGGFRGGAAEVSVSLPDPKLDNLGEILEQLNGATLQLKEAYASFFTAKDCEYISKLLEVFGDSEDLDDIQSLRQLCSIFKVMICLNDGALLEVLLSDSFFVSMAGVFEYDPELKHKGEHRKFLQHTARLKQILPLEDAEVIAKINQNFRVMFLKDVLLRPMMDDAVVSTLNSVTFFNNDEIISHMYHESDYLKKVFDLLRLGVGGEGGKGDGTEIDRQRRRDTLMFLRELFAKAKTLQMTQRDAFYRYLWNEVNFLDVFTPILKDPLSTVGERTGCMEVLLCSLVHDPSFMRMYIVKKGSHPPHPPHVAGQIKAVSRPEDPSHSQVASSAQDCQSLLFWVVRSLTSDTDMGVLVQASEICRMCLDTETMDSQTDRDNLLGTFYDHYIHWLVEPFWGSSGDGNGQGNGTAGVGASNALAEMADASVASKTSLGLVCDLLSFCVRSHTYRMKYVVLRHNIISGVLNVLQQKDSFLKLAVVRFLRSCISIKDEFYNRYFVKNNLLAPVFALLRENLGKDNLINSAIIEMVEFIRAENMKSLIEYLVERFGDLFKEGSGVPTFSNILIKYEQNKDYMETRDRDREQQESVMGRTSRAAQDRQRLLEDDEAYFNGSDDEEDVAHNSNATTDAVGPRPPAQGSTPPVAAYSVPLTKGSPPRAVAGLQKPPVQLVAYDEDDDEDAKDASAAPEVENKIGRGAGAHRMRPSIGVGGPAVGGGSAVFVSACTFATSQAGAAGDKKKVGGINHDERKVPVPEADADTGAPLGSGHNMQGPDAKRQRT